MTKLPDAWIPGSGLLEDPDTADWTRSKGQANGQRELKRIWQKTDANGPIIHVIAGELHTATTQAEASLIAAGLPIFQRGNVLVQPITREVPASHGRMTLSAGLGKLNTHSLVDVMCGAAEYKKFDARSKDWVRTNPPAQVANILLAREGKWNFPVVSGVITTPTMRPDGPLLTEPGYDAATRLYHAADTSIRLHPKVHSPTRELAGQALKVLQDLLSEFPFTDEPGKSVALSALITPVVRGALSVAPLHLFRAHAPGSGKSYLADISCAISAGRPCPVISVAADQNETEKRLATKLIAGHPIISIDNVNGELGGDLLCQAVERPLIDIRILGFLDMVEVKNSVTIFATGNNARVRGDMVRRTIITDLDAQSERPELRQFKRDPVETVIADRGRYVSACLVIVRAYITADTPDIPRKLASFGDWSALVRGALMWLGCADPVITMETAREDDPELTEIREMLNAWFQAFNTEAVTTKQVVAATDEKKSTVIGEPPDYAFPELRDIIIRLFGERGNINTRRLGNWLAGKEGRIAGGQRFKRADSQGHGGVVKWRIEKLS